MTTRPFNCRTQPRSASAVVRVTLPNQYRPMEPIETEYKGYRFRSRLEARWAVFFEYLGIDWQYEPEGFEFENGTRYLPDFYLPDTYSAASDDTYVEVKPNGKADTKGWDFTSKEHEEEREFSFSLILLSGQPRAVSERYWSAFREEWRERVEFDYEGHLCYDMSHYFCVCPVCRSLGFEFNGRAERIQCGCSISETHTRDDDMLLEAYNAASKARFEHGENGAV